MSFYFFALHLPHSFFLYFFSKFHLSNSFVGYKLLKMQRFFLRNISSIDSIRFEITRFGQTSLGTNHQTKIYIWYQKFWFFFFV